MNYIASRGVQKIVQTDWNRHKVFVWLSSLCPKIETWFIIYETKPIRNQFGFVYELLKLMLTEQTTKCTLRKKNEENFVIAQKSKA